MANWIKLADITKGSASHELDTGDWANPDNYRYLYMQFWTSGTNSSGADLHCQFNGDTSSRNYQYRWARAIATSMTDNSNATYDNIQLENADYDEGCFVTAHIVNHKTTLKTLISKSVKMGADANNDDPSVAPNSMETSGKWRNNSTSIKSIKVTTKQSNGTKDFNANSRLIVWGSDDTGTPIYPKLQDGTIYEEQDTGKIYIWNLSTNTWSEVK